MKFKKFFLDSLFFFSLLLAVSLPIRYYNQKKPLVSPISDIWQIVSVWSQDKNPIWRPEKQPNNLALQEVEVKAEAGLVINLTNNQLLWAKNANQTMPIASVTKIMTALVALESASLKQKMIVSHQAAEVGEATMNLRAGEKLTLEELLYGLMLVSGNDAAFAIAENIAGRNSLFINLMNEKARFLGLEKTKFYNPHGLDQENSQNNHSTAYELAILAKYTIDKFPEFKKIVGTDHIILEANKNHQRYLLTNSLGLGRTYPGLVGIKPGYTDSAGYCLVGLVNRKNEEVLFVLLNSPNLKQDLVGLLDYWLE